MNQKGKHQFEINGQKHFNVIFAYGNLDIAFGYNLGYNWLVAMLLHYTGGDEEKEE